MDTYRTAQLSRQRALFDPASEYQKCLSPQFLAAYPWALSKIPLVFMDAIRDVAVDEDSYITSWKRFVAGVREAAQLDRFTDKRQVMWDWEEPDPYGVFLEEEEPELLRMWQWLTRYHTWLQHDAVFSLSEADRARLLEHPTLRPTFELNTQVYDELVALGEDMHAECVACLGRTPAEDETNAAWFTGPDYGWVCKWRAHLHATLWESYRHEVDPARPALLQHIDQVRAATLCLMAPCGCFAYGAKP